MYTGSQRVTVSLPKTLVIQIDRLAKHQFGRRSSVVRGALQRYVQLPENEFIANPNHRALMQQYEELKADHPYLSPQDHQLITILYDLKHTKGEV